MIKSTKLTKHCKKNCRKRPGPNSREVYLNSKNAKHTRQIAGKYPPLIPISMIGIESIGDIEKKKIILQKHFLSPTYFDGIS